MQHFGDTIKNFRVQHVTINNVTPVIELYRAKPVKDGLRSSYYFCPTTLKYLGNSEQGLIHIIDKANQQSGLENND